MQPELDYYSILQLSHGASIESVRDQYRRLAKVFHPDRNAGDEWCYEQIKRINIAFEFLSSPERKAAYDMQLAKGAASLARQYKSVGTPARRPMRSGMRVAVARMPSYDFPETESTRSRWITAASWIAVIISVSLLTGAVVRQGDHGGGMRRMMLLPSLHTGLMAAFTGGGPRQIERAYRDQLAVLTDSAESGLDDARDTMSDLQQVDENAKAEPVTSESLADSMRRRSIEFQLREQSAGLQARLKIASLDINRFDWRTPGIRRRLHTSTIDEDISQIDNAIEPLHDTVCTAQEMIIDNDPFDTAPESAHAPASGI